MAHIQFWNTWWGEQWLNALANTDYSNRLPRWKSYARNWYVEYIEINKNKVSAKVAWSRRHPYNVDFSLKAFTKQEKQKIIDIITDSPVYLSSLLTRKLPTALFDEFNKYDIMLFPRSWKDIKADCSCPDWASCCKHIASVIFIIANEIDKNPFQVFELHDFDIFAELKKLWFIWDKEDKSMIKNANDLFWKKKDIKKFKLNTKFIDDLDFSCIPILGESLIEILSPNPLFFLRKDFKEILQKAYRIYSKEASRYVLHENPEDEQKENTEIYNKVIIELNKDLSLKQFLISSDLNQIKIINNNELFDIFNWISNIPAKKILFHNENIISLYYILSFSFKLVQEWAFIPQIVNTNWAYKINWIPALINKEVEGLFNTMLKITSPWLIKIIDSKWKKVSENYFKDQKEELLAIISIFISWFINNTEFGDRSIIDDEIFRMFFKWEYFKADQFENKQLPHTIALWLNRFFITHKDNVPVIQVEDKKSIYEVWLLVENKKVIKAPIALSKVLEDNKYKDIRIEILKDITLLAEHFPEMEKILASKWKDVLKYIPNEFTEVFFKYLPTLKLLNIPILLPKWLDELIRPKVSMKVEKWISMQTKRFLSLTDLLEFDWQIALWDKIINSKEFFSLVKWNKGIIKIKDQYIYIDEKEIEKILNTLNKHEEPTSHEKLQTILSWEYEDAKIHLSKEAEKIINDFLRIESIETPKTLNATLRDYQQRWFEWLYKNSKTWFWSLIADDMWLWKTIQVITLLLKLKHEGHFDEMPALIIVPTTLITNWSREIEKFWSNLNFSVFHWNQRRLDVENQDIVITTYGLVRSDINTFRMKKWACVILDEAQNIKNANTKQTKSIKALKSNIRIAMTWTPVENRLLEYWSIFDFLNKWYLKNPKAFKDDFAIPIEIERDKKKLELFKKITTPFILRRVKSDKSIIKDLPDKMEIDQYCNLNKDQAALYQNIMDITMKSIEKEEWINRRWLVLKLITHLKQICNHPAHYLKKWNASIDLSWKTQLLFELLDTIYENEEKTIIFTQYTEMWELLKKMIEEKYNSLPNFLHWWISRKKRDEMVDEFQNKSYAKTMILSLKAWWTWLNLTSAQNVIHFDLWWNPAVEMQATDRAYRIWQTKNVMVHRLITKWTFEEKIDSMIKAKKELADLTVLSWEKWIWEMWNKELRDFFSLK